MIRCMTEIQTPYSKTESEPTSRRRNGATARRPRRHLGPSRVRLHGARRISRRHLRRARNLSRSAPLLRNTGATGLLFCAIAAAATPPPPPAAPAPQLPPPAAPRLQGVVSASYWQIAGVRGQGRWRRRRRQVGEHRGGREVGQRRKRRGWRREEGDGVG